MHFFAIVYDVFTSGELLKFKALEVIRVMMHRFLFEQESYRSFERLCRDRIISRG